jgi:cytochrome c oxidase subunit 3
MLISELMLFLVCFWGLLNFRLISNAFTLFYLFPLLSSYAFSIPFSNLVILLFSSYPLNGSQIALKSGDLEINIILLNTSLSFGILSIVLQIKEFLYSFFSLSDCLIGSLFYFTTGLHGFHVVLGSFSFFVVILKLVFTLHCFLIEFSFGLFLSSFY